MNGPQKNINSLLQITSIVSIMYTFEANWCNFERENDLKQKEIFDFWDGKWIQNKLQQNSY